MPFHPTCRKEGCYLKFFSILLCGLCVQAQGSAVPPCVEKLLQFKESAQPTTGFYEFRDRIVALQKTIGFHTAKPNLESVSYCALPHPTTQLCTPPAVLENSSLDSVSGRLKALRASVEQGNELQYFLWDNSQLDQWGIFLNALKNEVSSERATSCRKKWIHDDAGTIPTTCGVIGGLAMFGTSVLVVGKTFLEQDMFLPIAFLVNAFAYVLAPAGAAIATAWVAGFRQAFVLGSPDDLAERLLRSGSSPQWFAGLTVDGISYDLLFTNEKSYQTLELLIHRPTLDFISKFKRPVERLKDPNGFRRSP